MTEGRLRGPCVPLAWPSDRPAGPSEGGSAWSRKVVDGPVLPKRGTLHVARMSSVKRM